MQIGAIRSIALAVLFLLCIGSRPMRAFDVETPPSLEISTSNSEALTLWRLEQLWSEDGEGRGGFGDTATFAPPPNVYATSYTLELVDLYGIEIPTLDRAATTAWLNRAIERPDIDVVLDPTPNDPLTKIQLATRALVRLGTPPAPNLVARQVATFRSGWGYAFHQDEDPTWGSTLVAVDTLVQLGLEVPGEVRQQVARSLPIVTMTTESPAAYASELLSVWNLAVLLLPAEERVPFRPDLSARFEEMIDLARGPSCNAITLIAIEMLHRISATEAIELPALDLQPCFDLLHTNSGYLSPFPGAQPDPAVSVDAAHLGRTAPPELAETVRRSANFDGWGNLPPAFETTPEATYRGLAVAHAVGSRRYDAPVQRGTEEWLTASEANVTSPATLRPVLRESFFVVALAEEAEVSLPNAIRERFGALLNDSALLTWNPTEQARAVQIALFLDQAVPSALIKNFSASLKEALDLEPPTNISALALLLTAGEAEPSADLQRRIDDEAAKYNVGDALFSATTIRPSPSLSATVIGLIATDRLEEDGIAALPTFANENGTWSAPPDGDDDPRVNIETTYLGLVLRGQISQETWLG